jgi:hypothetical protein
MKGGEYITILLFDLQINRRILNSLSEIRDNINKHMKVKKTVLI